MEGKDQVYCGKCREHQDHTKQVTLYRPPPVLIIHLKRFKFTQRHGEKILTQVNFPVQGLDLSFAYSKKPKRPMPVDLKWWEYLGGKYSCGNNTNGYTDALLNSEGEQRKTSFDEQIPQYTRGTEVPEQQKFLYDCVGVVNHFGGTSGGHYVAYAKNQYDKKWRQFDDSHVKVISPNEVVSKKCLHYVLH